MLHGGQRMAQRWRGFDEEYEGNADWEDDDYVPSWDRGARNEKRREDERRRRMSMVDEDEEYEGADDDSSRTDDSY